MLCYTSRQAYNSCLSLFPNISSKQQVSATNSSSSALKLDAKRNRLAQMKENRRVRFEKKERTHGLPQVNSENEADIIGNKEQYMEDAPSYKASSNSKINFQDHHQLEFEVNSDIESLHQMFPSKDLQIIYETYQSCSRSLMDTIDALLALPESSEISIPDIVDTDLWPSLPQHTEGAQSTKINVEMESKPDIIISHNQSLQTISSMDMKETDSDSDIDSDMVFVNSHDECVGSVHSSDEWIIIHDSLDEDEMEIGGSDGPAIRHRTPSFSYKDMLLAK